MSIPRGDYVFTFSYETYADARARGMMRPPDRLMSTLYDAREVDRLLVSNPYRWLPTALARRVVAPGARFPSRSDRRLVRPLRLARTDPRDLGALDAAYRRFGAKLGRVAAQMGMSSPDLVTVNPLVAGFAQMPDIAGVTYYGRDDWLSSSARRHQWPAFREAYRRIAADGAAVVAVSQEIIDRIEPTGPHQVVPNGVEPAEWTAPLGDPPRWFATLPQPRAVYVGTLDDRLDIDGIAHLARARPDLQVVLLGPLVDIPLLAPLRELRNITVHDRVGRDEVVTVLRHTEVTLVAHRRTPLTEAMSPLKLYEYLAAGTPALSIDLAPVRGISEHVRLVPEVADFAEVVDDVLAAPRATESERLAFVHANSWRSRHEAILSLRSRAERRPRSGGRA